MQQLCFPPLVLLRIPSSSQFVWFVPTERNSRRLPWQLCNTDDKKKRRGLENCLMRTFAGIPRVTVRRFGRETRKALTYTYATLSPVHAMHEGTASLFSGSRCMAGVCKRPVYSQLPRPTRGSPVGTRTMKEVSRRVRLLCLHAFESECAQIAADFRQPLRQDKHFFSGYMFSWNRDPSCVRRAHLPAVTS